MLIDKNETRELIAEKAEIIKESASAYIDFFRQKESDLSVVLRSIVGEHGRTILLDSEKLKGKMMESGVAESDVLKVLLMTKVVGLKKILETEGEAKRTDIDLYVRNAIEGTGFNRNKVLELTEAILVSTGSLSTYKYDNEISDAGIRGVAFAFPKGAYESELRAIEGKFQEAINGEGITLSRELIEKMRPLAEAGIPRAKYYLGAYYCKLKESPKDSPKGVELLTEAAEAGDGNAAALLADIFYNDPEAMTEIEKAYEYYTGFGSIALGDERKKRVVEIYNHKEYGKKILIASLGLIVLMTIFVFLAPGSMMHSPRRGIGIFVSLLAVVSMVLGVVVYRKNKYASLYWMPVVIMALYSVYFITRII